MASRWHVTANNGVLKLAVNGKEVSGVSESNPRKGYLALEAEGSECRFKNIKIKELPSTNPKPEEICDVDKGLKCLFTGLDLNGWKAEVEHKNHWTMKDGVLKFDGKTKSDLPLWSEQPYGDFELVCDWLTPSGSEIAIKVRGSKREIAFKDKKAGAWHRSIVQLKGNRVSLRIDGDVVAEDVELSNLPASGPIALVGFGPVQFRNVFIRNLK